MQRPEPQAILARMRQTRPRRCFDHTPTRGPRTATTHAWAFLVVAVLSGCSALSGGTQRTEAVLWYDEYDEVYTGRATRTGDFLSGGVVDVTNAAGDVRCVGESRARIVPPAVREAHCDGLAGVAHLSCSDGRTIALEYHVDATCLTGYGSGADQQGHLLHAVFGGSAHHARTIAEEARDHVKENPPLPKMAPQSVSGEGSAKTSTGTAFFVSWEGHLITNHHVIEDRDQVHVKISDGSMVRARVLAKDTENDLALLRVDVIREPLALRSDDDLTKGEQVFALGYPLIAIQGQEQKATFGRVNALSGLQGDARYAQVDVPIQPGNSGGPLLDKHGRVAGVMTSMLNPGAVMELAGVVPQNVNYALKAAFVRAMLADRLGDGDWTPAEARDQEREFAGLVESSEDSVVLVVAW